MIDWFVAWRLAADPARAQTVQVAHTAHALARAGARVHLPVDGDGSVLAELGLPPTPGLVVVALGRGTAASLRFRLALVGFLAATRGRGVVACRHLRYADAALRLTRGRVRLLYEPHEVARREAPGDALAWAAEARVLAGARWIAANAPGTLAMLREDHGPLVRAVVCPNGATPGLPPRADAAGVGVVGSVRPYKDPQTVARAAALRGGGVTWVGADEAAATELRAASGGALRVEPPIPHRDVAARLAGFRTLLLPLSPRDDFGDKLTSPLKLWDALASGVPLVAADTAAVRAAAEGAVVPYTPGDAASLVAALARAEDPAVRATVLAAAARRARTWDDRARELLALVGA